MFKRFAAFAVLGAACIAGCQDAPPPEAKPQGKPEPTVRVEKFKTGESYDPLSRHFRGNTMYTLPLMHAAYLQEFIEAQDFGVGRMPRRSYNMNPNWVEYIPDTSGRSTTGGSFQTEGYLATQVQIDERNGLLRLTDGTVKPVDEQIWTLKENRLVSLKDGKPIVYDHGTAHQHPEMTAGADYRKAMKFRELTEFETKALADLKDGHELVVETTPSDMRMIGGIRARNDCLACHKSNKEGDLLGAFTYTAEAVSFETKAEDKLSSLNGLSEEQQQAVKEIEKLGGKIDRDAAGSVTAISFNVNANLKEKNGRLNMVYIGNRVRNPDVKWLTAFPDLKELDIRHSRVNGGGLKELAKLRTLKTLNLEGAWITPDDVKEYQKQNPGVEVKFHNPTPSMPAAAPRP